MNNRLKVSLNVGFFVLISGVIFFIISLYLYQDFSSIKLFFDKFLDIYLNIYLLIGIVILSIISGVFTYIMAGNIFNKIEEYNTKLKDYNHYLAHELKTPISIVNSNLEVLEYGFDKNKINDSKNELKNMTRIIDGLLTFSESFNNIDKKEINIENFIKSLISLNKYSDNILIENSEFNFSINTDEVLFERVVGNLIENALKYSVDRSVKIKITSDKITFENEIYKTIDNEEIEKLFSKFYSKSCNENNGNGLGLSMIKEIVSVLGYDLGIKSEENKFLVDIIL